MKTVPVLVLPNGKEVPLEVITKMLSTFKDIVEKGHPEVILEMIEIGKIQLGIEPVRSMPSLAEVLEYTVLVDGPDLYLLNLNPTPEEVDRMFEAVMSLTVEEMVTLTAMFVTGQDATDAEGFGKVEYLTRHGKPLPELRLAVATRLRELRK